MKNKMIRFCIGLITILTIYSCKKEEGTSKDLELFNDQIKNLSRKKASPKNKDSILTAWRSIENSPLVKKDIALQANVKYNIGRVYGMAGEMDSAQIYIEKALELIEKTKGNLEIKAGVYNGMGNLSNNKAKEHQANYYYNKAATIILSNGNLDMPPATKTAMLLAAAQSNSVLYQYDLAQKMNKAALDLSEQLPPSHINRQRPLTQMIIIFGKQDKLDSIPPYIR